MTGGCIGGTPHVGHRPQLLWAYAASVQEVAKMKMPEQFRGNHRVLIVSALLREGLYGLGDMLRTNEISRHHAEQHRTGEANTLSCLVQFAAARRGLTGEGRDTWWPFYEEMCTWNSLLNRLFRGDLVPKIERASLCEFLIEFESWLVPEVRRQVREQT